MLHVPAGVQKRLSHETLIWFTTVRPDGRPHIAPLWFSWHADKLYICIEPSSVKARNLQQNACVAVALADGAQPTVCEGIAAPVVHPWPSVICEVFQAKYGWDITTDSSYTLLIEVTPTKWLLL